MISHKTTKVFIISQCNCNVIAFAALLELIYMLKVMSMSWLIIDDGDDDDDDDEADEEEEEVVKTRE